MIRRARILLMVPVLVTAAWACSDSNSGDSGGSGGAGQSSGTLIGPEGGTVLGDGVKIVIPPGALTDPTLISVEPIGSAPATYTAFSRLYRFGTDGTLFLKPVSVTFTTDSMGTSPVVYWTAPGSTTSYDSIAGTVAGADITADVLHFSQGFVGASAGSGGAGGSNAGGAGGAGEVAGAGGEGGVTTSGTLVTVTSLDALGELADQTWAAWQDEDGAWQALDPSSTGIYEFSPTASRYGFAIVCASSATQSGGQVLYSTVAVTEQTVTACAPVTYPPAHTLAMHYTNLPVGTLGMRHGEFNNTGFGSLTPVGGAADQTLYNFAEGQAGDLIFGAVDSGLPASVLLGGAFVRDVTVLADLQDQNLDFAGADSFAFGDAIAQVTNADADTYVHAYYSVNASPIGMLLDTGASDASALPDLFQHFGTVPDLNRLSSDQYIITVTQGASSDRHAVLTLDDASAGVTVAGPPAFAPTFSAATDPYPQPAIEFAAYPQATKYQMSWYYSTGQKGDSRSFSVTVDPAWLSGAEPYTLTFPDFSAVSTWDAAWAAPADAAAGSVSTTATAFVSSAIAGGVEEDTAAASQALP